MTSSRLPGHGPFPTPRQEPHDLQRAPLPPWWSAFDTLLLVIQLIAVVVGWVVVIWGSGLDDAGVWFLTALGLMGVRLVLKVGLRRG